MKRVCLASLLVMFAAVMGFGQTTFYYPQVANGLQGGTFLWKTTIFLTNPAATGTATASGSITLFKADTTSLTAAGTPFNITFVDENGAAVGSGNTIPFQIAGGQSRKFTSTGSGQYAGGYAVVQSSGTVNGTAIFSEFINGKLVGEAGVPASPAVTKQAIFVDTVGGYNLGVAYANTSQTTAANVTLTLLNSSAVTVATTTQVLGSNNQTATFTSQLFSNAPQLAGTMQISSNLPLTAIALRFDPPFSVFTTLPPVTLAALFDRLLGAVLSPLFSSLYVHIASS